MRLAIDKAVQHGTELNALCISALIRAGAPPNFARVDGVTCLHAAAYCGLVQLVEVLVTSTTDATCEDAYGNLPVDVAAGNNKDEVVGLLQPHSKSTRPRTLEVYGRWGMKKAIFIAMTSSDKDKGAALIAALIAKGGSPNGERSPGETALHAAAYCGSLPLVERLVTLGARADIEDKRGNLAVDLAAIRTTLWGSCSCCSLQIRSARSTRSGDTGTALKA